MDDTYHEFVISSRHGVVLAEVHRLKQICMTIMGDSISCFLFVIRHHFCNGVWSFKGKGHGLNKLA